MTALEIVGLFSGSNAGVSRVFVVQFNYPDRLFGLAERVVGVESLYV